MNNDVNGQEMESEESKICDAGVSRLFSKC